MYGAGIDPEFSQFCIDKDFYIPTSLAEFDIQDPARICGNCNGSGEGQHQFTKCPVCRGKGSHSHY
jgi:DnaJ-class molecular chaperone